MRLRGMKVTKFFQYEEPSDLPPTNIPMAAIPPQPPPSYYQMLRQTTPAMIQFIEDVLNLMPGEDVKESTVGKAVHMLACLVYVMLLGEAVLQFSMLIIIVRYTLLVDCEACLTDVKGEGRGRRGKRRRRRAMERALPGEGRERR